MTKHKVVLVPFPFDDLSASYNSVAPTHDNYNCVYQARTWRVVTKYAIASQ